MLNLPTSKSNPEDENQFISYLNIFENVLKTIFIFTVVVKLILYKFKIRKT